jgi:sphingomyelin phosphodiesterase
MADEAVYIIGHLPPGNHECMPVWSHNYARIVHRFESTIKGQFFGHTHHDEFSIYRDPQELRRATNVAFISPSITAYRKVQPSYRIFHLDGRRWESSWVMTIT